VAAGAGRAGSAMTKTTHATYLYGVVHAGAPPDAAGAPAGLSGTGPLRFVPLGGDLWLAAADAPLARYGAAPIERSLKDLEWVSACALAHERMVEHLATLGTVVPMKLFTLFTTDARATADVGRTRRRLGTLARKLKDRQEWGVRVSRDEEEMRTAARQHAARAADGLTPGARFLTLKSVEKTESRRQVDRGKSEAERVFKDVARHADDTRRRTPGPGEPGLRLLLDAVFLVPRAKAERVRQAVDAQARRLAAQGYRVVLTGPWPPYSFVGPA
jgi:hypothetical protein